MKIYCVYCDAEHDSSRCTDEIAELAKILTISKKDTVPWLACRKCLGYRRRSRRRKAGINYQN